MDSLYWADYLQWSLDKLLDPGGPGFLINALQSKVRVQGPFIYTGSQYLSSYHQNKKEIQKENSSLISLLGRLLDKINNLDETLFVIQDPIKKVKYHGMIHFLEILQAFHFVFIFLVSVVLFKPYGPVPDWFSGSRSRGIYFPKGKIWYLCPHPLFQDHIFSPKYSENFPSSPFSHPFPHYIRLFT